MLGRAHAAGWPPVGYERDGHPVQESVLASVSAWTGVPSQKIPRSVDGCGVVVFWLPLENMAAAYARLADAAARADEIPARIVNAIRTRPFLFGGTERFD